MGNALVLIATASAALFYWFHPRSALDDFWSSILKTSETLIIYLPIPDSYRPLGEAEARRFPIRRGTR
jgi:hypothetical protein